MKLFVGLDVSLSKTAVCVLTEHGKIVREVEVASEPEPLITLLTDLDGTTEAIGLEAGPLSRRLHRAMTDAGLFPVLMETRQVKGALKAMPIKTDRRDAEGIAAIRLDRLVSPGPLQVHFRTRGPRFTCSPKVHSERHYRNRNVSARSPAELWSQGGRHLARQVRGADPGAGGRQHDARRRSRTHAARSSGPSPGVGRTGEEGQADGLRRPCLPASDDHAPSRDIAAQCPAGQRVWVRSWHSLIAPPSTTRRASIRRRMSALGSA